MEFFRTIGLFALIGLVGCGQPVSTQTNVKVKRGEAIIRENAEPKPFIEEIYSNTGQVSINTETEVQPEKDPFLLPVDDSPMATALANTKIVFDAKLPGSKPVAINFMAKGNWHDELGRSGRYTVEGTTITLTDPDGVSTKQQFPRESLATGDKVTVEMTKGQQALFKKQGVEVDPENPVYQAEITELGIADTFTAKVPNPTSPAEPNKLAVPVKIGDYSLLGFDRLSSFAYEVPDDPITEPKAKKILESNEIPESIKKFDGQKVALKGFMLPLKVEDGLITELLILRDQSLCCYGAVPKINEWVSVRMPGNKGVKPIMDVPVTIFGTLKVGEVLENSYLVGIYEMDGERLDGPIDL